MSLDSRFVGEMWRGSLAVQFTLAPQELTSLDAPFAAFILCRRHAYFPFYHYALRQAMSDAKLEVEDELWLEWKKLPVKWALPVGVVADIATALHLHSHSHSQPSSPLLTMENPLSLTLHFQQFPSKKLSRCKSLFTVRQHYLSTVKEATFVRYGHSKAINSASPQDCQRLWDSVVEGKHDAYQTIVNQLFTGYESSLTSQLPVKIFLVNFIPISTNPSSNGGGDGDNGDEIAFLPMQRPVASVRDDGRANTVHDVLLTLIPHLITGADTPSPASDSLAVPISDIGVLVQGLAVPLTTPVSWLYEHCAHPDMFLYLTVYRKKL